MNHKKKIFLSKYASACAYLFLLATVAYCYFWAASLFSLVLAKNSRTMAPSLLGGYSLLASSTAYDKASPAVGDVVVFRDSAPNGGLRVARATPCSGSETRSGMYRDWFAEDPDQAFICVAPDDRKAAFVEGMNPIPLAAVEGKAIFVYSPLSAVGFIPKWPEEDAAD